MKAEHPPAWSIVIPAFNEETRLPVYLKHIWEFVKAEDRRFEIIVADDGSTDATAPIVRRMMTSWEGLRLEQLPVNRGKGAAVRQGILVAQGRRILFTDADGSTPIRELYRLEEAINQGADLAIGSREKHSEETRVEALAARRLIGRSFHFLLSLIGVRGIKDTQCGFKAFRYDVAQTLFQASSIDGFGFDVEILLLARTLKYRIAEVPVNWSHVEGSKVSLIRDAPRMAMDVIRVRAKLLRGAYDSLET